MSYNADKPITSEKEDVLGRKDFSKRLGRLIYNYQEEDGLVLGLYGEWGSGKTSVINMAEEEINRLIILDVIHKHAEGKISLTDSDTNSPLLMRFSPWNYSDKDNLISLFFLSLKNKIARKDDKEFKSKVGKALDDYVEAFDALSLVPIVGHNIASLLKSLIKAFYKKKGDLDEVKKYLEKVLKKAKKKIVIVIDDIDRLTNTQIRDIFQLVKSVGDFPYVIYVLAMDREIVARALTEVHQTDGSRYLEKIIQMPVELPKLSKTELEKILREKINKIKDKFPGKVAEDYWYEEKVFENCVYPYITTLRDVNRLINIFQFRYEMLYEETSFEDMLGITTLEVFEPKLYRWIYDNKEAVCGGMNDLLSDDDTNPDYRQFYSDEFITMGINPDRAIHCIATMFPMFPVKIKEKYAYRLISNLRDKIQVANEKKFELYFVFNLENIRVPRSVVNACLFKYDKVKLSEEIGKNIEKDRNNNTEDNIIYILDEITAQVDLIPYNRLDLIASVVFDLQGRIKVEYNNLTNSNLSGYNTSKKLIYSIINRFEEREKKYKFINDNLRNINKFGLGLIASIMCIIEGAYGKLEEYSGNEHLKIISLEHLKELENSYVEKIRTISKVESILEISEFREAFNLWWLLDKEGVKLYLEEVFKNEVNALKFICIMMSEWASGGWNFYLNEQLEYISEDKLYNTIQDFDKRKLDEFTETEQIKLASFYLGYSKKDVEKILETEAEKLLNEWKTAQ